MASTCSREFAKMRRKAKRKEKAKEVEAKRKKRKVAERFCSEYVSIDKLVSAFEKELEKKGLKDSWYIKLPVRCSSWKSTYYKHAHAIRDLIRKEFTKKLAECFKVKSCEVRGKSGNVHISIRVSLIKEKVPEVSSSYQVEESSSSSSTT